MYFILFLPHPHICSIAGGWDANDEHEDTVLEFDKETETWSEVGHMMRAEGMHALSVVNFSDFADWCQWSESGQ